VGRLVDGLGQVAAGERADRGQDHGVTRQRRNRGEHAVFLGVTIADQPDHQIGAALFDEQCRPLGCWHQPTLVPTSKPPARVEAEIPGNPGRTGRGPALGWSYV
jgi:hypothetical protein